MKVLIVEDNDIFRESLESAMALLGHEIIAADNGADALRLLTVHHPDLVTVDGTLVNNETGLSVARKIREADSNVLIVMITGDRDVRFEGRGICKMDLVHQDLETLLTAQLP